MFFLAVYYKKYHLAENLAALFSNLAESSRISPSVQPNFPKSSWHHCKRLTFWNRKEYFAPSRRNDFLGDWILLDLIDESFSKMKLKKKAINTKKNNKVERQDEREACIIMNHNNNTFWSKALKVWIKSLSSYTW